MTPAAGPGVHQAAAIEPLALESRWPPHSAGRYTLGRAPAHNRHARRRSSPRTGLQSAKEIYLATTSLTAYCMTVLYGTVQSVPWYRVSP